MREKLALTIAMAGFAVVTALGVGSAGADPATGLGQNRALDGQVTAIAPEGPPACANGIDDDGDTLIDLDDPECEEAGGLSEDPEADEATGAVEQGGQGQGGDAAGQKGPTGTQAPARGKPTAGATLRASEAPDAGADQQGGKDSGDGAVTAPRATAGDQPAATGPDGGSQFGDGGSPGDGNPTTTIASFGPAPIGVANFVIDSFEIPPFLLPIYQACGTEYGIPWQVLASINKIETAFGTNLSVSSAGAMGWMQFIPSSWEMYGVDANGDGLKDPYNPVDAICAAANYLNAAGAREDLYKAIFAYNHADWYVQEVLLYARAYGKLPADLIGSLTGLTEGAHFPVAADARYADDISTREALRRATPRKRAAYGNAAEVISSSPTRRGINIFAAVGAPVVAVNDGVIVKLGYSETLGKHVVLRDAYGNRYTYAKLGKLTRNRRLVVMPSGEERRVPVDSEDIRPRLRALPERADEERERVVAAPADPAAALSADGSIRVGSRVIAGTVLGRIGEAEDGVDPHLNFAIQPAGRGAPQIDPKPILDGWKLLEATAIYRAKGKNPFAERLGSAGVLLLSKEALQRRVLADRGLEFSDCDRGEIRKGQIDRRLLATLAYLSEQGFELTVTSMLCGRHGSITTSGNVSNHSFGGAADIAVINDVPVLGNQGPGTLVDSLLKAVLRLQGSHTPDELISLETLGGPSFAMSDHADHVHIGWRPLAGLSERQFVQLLKPDQWTRLTERLEEIDNPRVPTKPSKFSQKP